MSSSRERKEKAKFSREQEKTAEKLPFAPLPSFLPFSIARKRKEAFCLSARQKLPPPPSQRGKKNQSLRRG